MKIAASERLDVWPIKPPGLKAAIPCQAWRHPFQGVFYTPVIEAAA